MSLYLCSRNVVIAGAVLGFAWNGLAQSAGVDWSMAGQDVNNSRSQPGEHVIGKTNVNTLFPKWEFTTGGDVSATPTVAGGVVYFPDWAGNLYAVNAVDGSLLWSHPISDYDGFPGSVARVSPAVHGGDIILGDIESSVQAHQGANVMAVDRGTGKLHWITPVDSHPAAIITGSPVVLGDVVYVGVSSIEEALAVDPAYPCCSFRGSMVAMDANTGAILWQTFTVPDNSGQTDGYSGGAIWQPPAIDPTRGLLFIGTGNNYEVPGAVKDCIADLDRQFSNQQATCFAAGDHFDSALAVNLTSGNIVWAMPFQNEDVWTQACLQEVNLISCPEPRSPDYDFGGSGPNLVGDIVGFGQKSGMYWALAPDTGQVVWSAIVGPGSTMGGVQWGTATDGNRIYVAISNGNHQRFRFKNDNATDGGLWTALDVATGRIIWQTADPDGSLDPGSLSVANGVVYAPSLSGNLHAIDAGSGQMLWTFPSGGSVIDGPAIANGVVYWGSGYGKIPTGIANNKVFAFETAP